MDAIRTEVMRNRFAALVEEASIILYKTAHTTFIKQTQDYQCAMCTVEGEVFAYPRSNGVATLVGLSLKPAIDWIGVENMRPGDVIITNDPFSTEGMCTHTPDIFTLRPIFHEGELLCFSWAFAHVSDVGGAVPSSISPSFTEIFQEGLRLRPVKLFREGELNAQLKDIISDNCRIPSETWGDIIAMCSALASMDRRIIELVDRYSVDDLTAGIREVLAYGEAKAREVISDLPDGSWSFSDYIEVVAGQPLLLRCTMTVTGSDVLLDFTGSSPQVQAACNFVTGAAPHPALVRCFVAYLLSSSPEMPMNGGIVRPIRTRAPKGVIMNAEFPAASGNRAASYTRIYDLVLGCLNQAIPEALAGGGGSQAAIIAASVTDPLTRKPRVSVIQPLIGGSGGRRSMDGIDAIDTPFGFLRSAPTESVEHEMPFLVRRFGLVTDSFGAGRYRGGAALEIELENRSHEATFSVRGCDRFTFQPWGVAGGAAGHCGGGWKNGAPVSMIELQKLGRGDRLHLRSPSGGGFGDPLERDPEAVLLDVRDGLLSEARALADYGVVIRDGALDPEATGAARAEAKARAEPQDGLFNVGAQRRAYEIDWPEPSTVALSIGLLEAPSGLRSAVRTWVTERQPKGAGPETVNALLKEGLAQIL
ncbi:hydantoinase B/oxoprolinase family protein [Salipiger abyssi]|uniref:hydantoinase B/oxoprolinase family protein n=1 Tax=Salipiger abyssi TaxID=1250539 RepID=UPI0040595F8E